MEKGEAALILAGGKIIIRCRNLTQEKAQAARTVKDALIACHGEITHAGETVGLDACRYQGSDYSWRLMANALINRDGGDPAEQYTKLWSEYGREINIDENGDIGYSDLERFGRQYINIIADASENRIEEYVGIKVYYEGNHDHIDSRLTAETRNAFDTCIRRFGR